MIEIILIFILVLVFYILLFSYHKKIENFQSNSVIDIDKGFKNYDEIYDELKLKKKKNLPNNLNIDITGDLKDKFLSDYKGEGIYYNIPQKNNSLLVKQIEDNGVLKNKRIKKNLNSYSEELNLDEMNKILNTIEIKKYYKLNKDLETDKDLYKNIGDKIIFEINILFKKFKLGNKKHLYDTRKYKLFSYNVVSDELIEGRTKDNRNLILNIIFFKIDKDQYFTTQVNCIYNYSTNSVEINQLDIIGINEQENITFSDIKKPEQKYCLLDDNNLNENKITFYNNEFNINKLEKCHDEKLINNKLNLELFQKEFDENEVKNFIKKKDDMQKQAEEDKKYKCFLKDGFNESSCKSYSLAKKTSGVYDKPCNFNEECPFYKKNKNYKNSRGGCVKGYCEMPLNIERVGYKVYYSKDNPFCHNCNRKNCLGEECFTCCEEQKNRKKYINLKSPDYMFSNDGR